MSEQALRSTNNQGAILDRYEHYERTGVSYCGAKAVAHYFAALDTATETGRPDQMTLAFDTFVSAYRANRGEAADATALEGDEARYRSLNQALQYVPFVDDEGDLRELQAQLAIAPADYILQSSQELFDGRKQLQLRIGRVSLAAVEAMRPTHQVTEQIQAGQRDYLFCGCGRSNGSCPRHRLKRLLVSEASQFTAEGYEGASLADVRSRLDGNVSAAIASELTTLDEALPVLSQLYRDVSP